MDKSKQKDEYWFQVLEDLREADLAAAEMEARFKLIKKEPNPLNKKPIRDPPFTRGARRAASEGLTLGVPT